MSRDTGPHLPLDGDQQARAARWWDAGSVAPDLGELEARLNARRLSLRVRTWVRGNEAFPVRATTALNVSGPPWDDDVVLSADILVVGNELVFESDIARADGQILVQGPRSTCSCAATEAAQAVWAEQCRQRYVEFVRTSLTAVGRELEARGLPEPNS